jgi:trans-2,3-dihydro-3-hydroxyanthranilate isomerase
LRGFAYAAALPEQPGNDAVAALLLPRPRSEPGSEPTVTMAVTRRLPFYLVDVFAVGPLTGNPVAVVPDADPLPLGTMHALAREFNQSERDHVPAATRTARGRVTVTLLHPIGAEVFGAGHNALGAWLWLASAGRLGDRPQGRFIQQIGPHLLAVTVSTDEHGAAEIAMDQSPPRFGSVVDNPAGLADALGLSAADIATDLPVQVVSTGAAHLLVPLHDRAAVDRAMPDTARLTAMLRAAGGEGCHLYAPDPVEPTSLAYTCFFNPTMGIWEDPATGTAAGPLARCSPSPAKPHPAPWW